MGRPLKSSRPFKGPPKWFRLPAYTRAQSWTEAEWWSHLSVRQNLALALSDLLLLGDDKAVEQRKNRAGEAVTHLHRDPVQRLEDKGWCTEFLSPSGKSCSPRLRDTGVRSATADDLQELPPRLRQELGDFLSTPALASFLDPDGKQPPAWRAEPLDEVVMQHLLPAEDAIEETPADAAAVDFLESQIPRLCVVDLSLPKDALMDAFSKWLDQTPGARAPSGRSRKKGRPRNAINSNDLFKRGVLPALDLRLHEIRHGAEFGPTAIARWIWAGSDDRYEATWPLVVSLSEGTIKGRNCIERLRRKLLAQ
jgi:hypothetical protein